MYEQDRCIRNGSSILPPKSYFHVATPVLRDRERGWGGWGAVWQNLTGLTEPFNAFIKSGYIECLISKLSDLSRVK